MGNDAMQDRVDPEAARRAEQAERFAMALRRAGFSGDIDAGYAARQVLATDNSIYQRVPQLALFPRTAGDIAIAATTLAEDDFAGMSLTARGAGTGTNGQSLTTGVVLDCSRHLTGIGPFDPERGEITVEPGVVLDQLNAFLEPHGVFFPPNVSTASRATIGGMVATDASGKGSRIYGKTSDYVLGMDVVLADGSTQHFSPGPPPGPGAPDHIRKLHAELLSAAPLAESHFPRMNRGLTGYNLRDALPSGGSMNLCKLLSGSEGTLALTSSILLRVIPRPRHSALAVLFYDDFFTALDHVETLLDADPLAVEIIDDKVLRLARHDPVWMRLGDLFGALDDDLRAINVVEFVGDDEAELLERLAAFQRRFDQGPATGLRLVTASADIKATWALRAKAVGLMGNVAPDQSAVAFVEDAAVPPAELAAFARAFCAILDREGYAYGMYGHADVGCLHVRPIMDMRQPADRAAIRRISDEVAALAARHGGLLWGEHGRGVRGEYSPLFFGPELYPALGRIKAILDPHNRFNPGKLAAPDGSPHAIDRIDLVPMRGAFDAEIGPVHAEMFARAIACNGNGACHSWDRAEEMCPSFKATRDKTQSPKGRAVLIREWARTGSVESGNALLASLETCLSCRACAGQCPVRVDIPTMKSRVLDTHYSRHARPIRDRLIAVMEPMLLVARKMPALSNVLLHNALSRFAASRVFGMVDLPRFAPESIERALRRRRIALATPERLADLSDRDRARAVIVVPDSFLGSFDTAPVLAAAEIMQRLGRLPLVAPVHANGKALEVRGFLAAYARVRARQKLTLAGLAGSGLPLVGIEPSTRLQSDSDGDGVVQPIDAFLLEIVEAQSFAPGSRQSLRLLSHCTEKALDPASAGRWSEIFARLGHSLTPVSAGCCGMSGLFGHEAEHADLSRRIFDLAWADAVLEPDTLATGFSCRCQASRFGGVSLRHPLELLADLLSGHSHSVSA